MKFSIITPSYNNEIETLEICLDSVAGQQGVDIEHIVIVKTPSDETTVRLLSDRNDSNLTWISEPDHGPYDAFNKGLAMATGEVVGFLNADDFYAHTGVLKRIHRCLEALELDACYGDLIYLSKKDTSDMVRYWKSRSFRPGMFRYGWMPPHPTFYARREVYERYGMFDTRYSIASDWELLMRLMELERIRTRYIPEVLVHMKLGGISNRSFKNIAKANIECLAAALRNGFWLSPIYPVSRPLQRFFQFRGY